MVAPPSWPDCRLFRLLRWAVIRPAESACAADADVDAGAPMGTAAVELRRLDLRVGSGDGGAAAECVSTVDEADGCRSSLA